MALNVSRYCKPLEGATFDHFRPHLLNHSYYRKVQTSYVLQCIQRVGLGRETHNRPSLVTVKGLVDTHRFLSYANSKKGSINGLMDLNSHRNP
jgi:hypothetical protein